MNCLRITCYTVLRNLRNWKLFLLLIVVPLLNYLICAYITPNVILNIKFENTRAAYYKADDGPTAQQFERFLQTKEIQPAFTVQKADSWAKGKRMVESGEIEDFIYIPEDFSQNFDQGKEARIEISSNQKNSATGLLVESFMSKGNIVLEREVANTLSAMLKEGKKVGPEQLDISQRELEILKLVGEGLSNREIAKKLYLSEGTARNYVTGLLEKLGLRDRTQLAIFYIRNWE